MKLLPESAPGSAVERRIGDDQLALIEGEAEGARYRLLSQGAQLLEWAPKGEAPVIWISPHARFIKGKPPRGGIPVCWPWFGPSEDATLPAHGYARNAEWEVTNFIEDDQGVHHLHFRLQEAATPNPDLRLEARLSIGDALHIELSTSNLGHQDFRLTEALHSYFGVSDVRNIEILGLGEGCYLDRLDKDATKKGSEPLTLSGETDRIYLNAPSHLRIKDPGLGRYILIETRNAKSAIVWNPWATKAHALGDLGVEDYLQMVCVESGNTAGNAITLPPGESHTLSITYRTEPL